MNRIRTGKKFKVGVLTLHYGYNEGAVLQSYCLVKILDSIEGVRAEVIDLRYAAKVDVYGPPADQRTQAISNSISDWLPCSEKRWSRMPDRSFYQELEETYDAIVVGSDIVWSLKYTRSLRSVFPGGLFSRQKEPFFPKFPNAYWLPQRMSIPKFSYAASIGSFDWSTAPKGHLRRMKTCLEDFAAISIRDQKTQMFLNALDPGLAIGSKIVPDPTLCVELDQINPAPDKVVSKLISWGLSPDRKRVGYLLGDLEKYQILASFFTSMNWQSASLTTRNRLSDVRLYDKPLPPQDWARAIGFFDFVITERMHGMIFCLKNRVPFLAVDINPNTPEKPSKVFSLLQKFELLESYQHRDSDPVDLLATLEVAYKRNWDWKRIDEIMTQLGRDGHGFLSELLVGEGGGSEPIAER